jgi:hypothetical protein
MITFSPRVAVVLLWAACSSSSPAGRPDGSVALGPTEDGGALDASMPVSQDASVVEAGVPTGCAGSVSICTSYNTRSFCMPTTSGGVMTTETCPAGCYLGQCSTTACSDECALGSTSSAGTCQLWNMSTASFVSPDDAGKLHDRARGYDKALRAIDLPEGAVMNATYTDTTRTKLSYYFGYGDSSIWTGTALAAEGWRLLVTGEPDAAAMVNALANEIHLFFHVSGDPAYLARVAVASPTQTALQESTPCTNSEWHCGVSYNSKVYNWLGHTSRDQYTGAMLGYAIAYLASAGNEPLRKMIRDDVVSVVSTLMTPQQVHATITIDNNILPITVKKTFTLENVILAPSEMTGGQVMIYVNVSDAGAATIAGMRDFLPDFGVAAQQLIGIGAPIKRPSTAMMLGGYFQMALMMTDGVAGMEPVHQNILNYYNAHAAGWLDIAEGWSFSANCGSGYFANHIAFIMAYVWGLLEKNPSFAPRIQGNVLNNALWAALRGHKNSYFGFLWGATQAAPPAADISSAVTQLTQFPVGPRIYVGTDFRTDPRYMPHDATCGATFCDTGTLAVDVKDRRLDDFIWQRQPWLLYDGGDQRIVYPGVDYLAAYWAGRYHGFLSEDTAGTCARYAP